MEPEELLRYTRDVCDQLKLTYLVVGSTATIAYGEPRFTNDLDVVIDLPASAIDDFCSSFPVDEFYISRDAVKQAVQNQFQFNVIHPNSGLKIDFMILSQSDYDQSRRSRRRELRVFEDGTAWFTSPSLYSIREFQFGEMSRAVLNERQHRHR